MLDLVLLIILIAWFFGISFGAALHGLLQFVGIAVVIGIVIAGISLYGEISQFKGPVAQPAKKPVQKVQKPVKKKPSKHGDLFVWVCLFIASYCITAIIFMLCQFNWSVNFDFEPYWLSGLLNIALPFALPTIPFDIYMIYRVIKKHVGKNRRAS